MPVLSRTRLLFVCVAFCLCALAVSTIAGKANVSLKNGNFFVGFADATAEGGLEMKVERVYNSKTEFSGIFGPGWGCDFEAYIEPLDDGSLNLHEYGGGAENLFSPEPSMVRSLPAIIDELMAAAERSGKFSNAQDRTIYRTYLQTHHQAVWVEFRNNNLIPAIVHPLGQTFSSYRFGNERLVRTANGYLRREGEKTESFDDNGKLAQISDSNRNFIAFTYDGGTLSRMEDNIGNRFLFTFAKGRVKSIKDAGTGRLAVFDYKEGRLAYSKDVDGNVYRYEYDKRYNMTAIRYSDHTSQLISYYPMSQSENVRSVTDRDGLVTKYRYSPTTRVGADDHYTVYVDEFDKKGKPISRQSYEYFVTSDNHTDRLITTLDGDKTDTTYDAADNPLKIVSGDEMVQFAYDSQERLISKITTAEKKELQYDAVTGKVSQVVTTPSDTGKPVTLRYSYDAKGNLTRALGDDGNDLTLTYSDSGLIESVTNQGKKMSFTYNRIGKPVTISVEALGTISVTYKSNGDIDKVTSTKGREIALQVTKMMQDLLDMVRPAGVTLGL